MWTYRAKNSWVFATIVLALALTVAPGRADTEQAKQILDAAGVKGGLIVHIGCGSGRLTSALRANDSYVVHGLDRDPGNVAAARKHFGPATTVLLKPTDGPSAIATLAEWTRDYDTVDGGATAYVCRDRRCDLPTNDVDRMLDLLTDVR